MAIIILLFVTIHATLNKMDKTIKIKNILYINNVCLSTMSKTDQVNLKPKNSSNQFQIIFNSWFLGTRIANLNVHECVCNGIVMFFTHTILEVLKMWSNSLCLPQIKNVNI